MPPFALAETVVGSVCSSSKPNLPVTVGKPSKTDISTLLSSAVVCEHFKAIKREFVSVHIFAYSKKKKIKIIQQTNENNISNLSNFYSKNNIENQIFNFDNNFINIMRQADLCVTRAGASTLAELSVMNIPFIAVPLPSSKDDHQFENANFYKDNECCWLIEQNTFEEKIVEILTKILNDKGDYLKKKENLKKINYQNTWINVNQKILKIINEN